MRPREDWRAADEARRNAAFGPIGAMLEHMYRGDGKQSGRYLRTRGSWPDSSDARVFIVEMGGIVLQTISDMFHGGPERFGSTCKAIKNVGHGILPL